MKSQRNINFDKIEEGGPLTPLPFRTGITGSSVAYLRVLQGYLYGACYVFCFQKSPANSADINIYPGHYQELLHTKIYFPKRKRLSRNLQGTLGGKQINGQTFWNCAAGQRHLCAQHTLMQIGQQKNLRDDNSNLN